MSDPTLWKNFEYPEDTFRKAMEDPSLKDLCYGLYQLTRACKLVTSGVTRAKSPTPGANDPMVWKAFQYPEDDFRRVLESPDLGDLCYGLYTLTRAFKQIAFQQTQAKLKHATVR